MRTRLLSSSVLITAKQCMHIGGSPPAPTRSSGGTSTPGAGPIWPCAPWQCLLRDATGEAGTPMYVEVYSAESYECWRMTSCVQERLPLYQHVARNVPRKLSLSSGDY